MDPNISLINPIPEYPQHGNQGDRNGRTDPQQFPTSLTITISREAGTRGSTIAKKIGERLGWQVYSSDLFEYSHQDERVRQDLFDSLDAEATEWVDAAVSQFFRDAPPDHNQETREIVRMILCLGIRGDCVIVGRGAHCVLPNASTLKVRLIAPLQDRIAYMGQWMRLTRQEAEKQVAIHDRKRSEFVETHFRTPSQETHQYDMVLNTGLLGADLSTELVIQAAKTKMANMVHKHLNENGE